MSLPKLPDDEPVFHKTGESEAKNGTDSLAHAGMGANLVDDATVQKAIGKLVEALQAEKIVWGKTKEQFERSPDWPTIVRSAELLLAYGPGRPIERQVRLTGDVASYDDRLEKLLASPAGLALAAQLGLVQDLKDAKPARKPKATTGENDDA